MVNHKEVVSPWSDAVYTIRELDPALLADMSPPETPEIQAKRQRLADLLDDYDFTEDRIKKGVEKQSKLDEIQNAIVALNSEINEMTASSEERYQQRFKIIKFGVVSPKIRTEDEFLDLGKDASILFGEIIKLSKAPDDYKEVVSKLFRQEKPDDQTGSDNRENIRTETVQSG